MPHTADFLVICVNGYFICSVDNISNYLWEHRLLDVEPAKRLRTVHDVSGVDDNDVACVTVTRLAHRRWLLT